MVAKAKGNLPDTHRLRPRELFFMLLGTATGGGLGVFTFKVVPEALAEQGLTRDALQGLDAALASPALQVAALFVGLAILAAGVATRISSGKDRATWILAGGSVFLFGMLLLTINVLYDPVLANVGNDQAEDATPQDDDWED